jgi:hypothetical protein
MAEVKKLIYTPEILEVIIKNIVLKTPGIRWDNELNHININYQMNVIDVSVSIFRSAYNINNIIYKTQESIYLSIYKQFNMQPGILKVNITANNFCK